ncbi:MAG: helix-turn-helix domain-containing protein [Sphingomonadales bacterium]
MKIGELACGGPSDRASLRRGRIVDTARILFAANGFHATGMAQIAKESGIAIGQIYRDFAAKEDIVAAIVTGDCRKFMAREALQRAIVDRDEAAVWSWIRELVEPNADDSGLFMEIVAESARNERIAAIFAASHVDVIGCLLDALRLFAPDDRLAERCALLADMILTQSLGIMQHRVLMPGMDTRRLVDAVMFIMTREIERMREPCSA